MRNKITGRKANFRSLVEKNGSLCLCYWEDDTNDMHWVEYENISKFNEEWEDD